MTECKHCAMLCVWAPDFEMELRRRYFFLLVCKMGIAKCFGINWPVGPENQTQQTHLYLGVSAVKLRDTFHVFSHNSTTA